MSYSPEADALLAVWHQMMLSPQEVDARLHRLRQETCSHAMWDSRLEQVCPGCGLSIQDLLMGAVKTAGRRRYMA